MKKLILLITILMLFNSANQAQEYNIDSLIKVANTLQDDTTKGYICEKIATYGPEGIWQKYNLEAGRIAIKLMKSENPLIVKSAKNIFVSYNENLAYDYAHKGNFNAALECYDESLKIVTELNNNLVRARILSSMSNVFERQNELDKALELLLIALKIQRESNPPRYKDMSATLNNLAVLSGKKNNAKLQLAYYKEAEKIIDEHHLYNQILPSVYRGLGLIMLKKNNDELAKMYFNKCYAVSEKLGDYIGLSSSLEGLAMLSFKSGQISEAENLATKALLYANKSNIPLDIKSSALLLKKIYLKQANFKKALEMSDLAAEANDSLNSASNQKAVFRYKYKLEYDLKQANQLAKQEKKDAVQRNIQNSITLALAGVIIFLIVVYRQRNLIAKAQKRSDELLLNILPAEVAEELKAKGSAEAKQFEEVTVMFTDFKGFTQISENLSAAELVAEIHNCFKSFDHIITKHNIEKIKTIGDSYMCVGGLPVSNSTHAIDVIHAAMEIQEFMRQHLLLRKKENKEQFEIRIGVHTGSVVAGIVGIKKFAYDIWGDTVNIANRMEGSGETGKINISGSTYALIKDKFNCTHRGKIQAKGKGEIDMYFVEGIA